MSDVFFLYFHVKFIYHLKSSERRQRAGGRGSVRKSIKLIKGDTTNWHRLHTSDLWLAEWMVSFAVATHLKNIPRDTDWRGVEGLENFHWIIAAMMVCGSYATTFTVTHLISVYDMQIISHIHQMGATGVKGFRMFWCFLTFQNVQRCRVLLPFIIQHHSKAFWWEKC